MADTFHALDAALMMGFELFLRAFLALKSRKRSLGRIEFGPIVAFSDAESTPSAYPLIII